LPNENSLQLHYAEAFRCIGSACEDTCCEGWNVPVDHDTWRKYNSLPDATLPNLIRASLRLHPEETRATPAPCSSNSALFAVLRMNQEHRCPLLTEERLCRVHRELGESLLSQTCATYPRIMHALEDVQETALALSCPEAARLVLLSPDLCTQKAPTQLQTPSIDPNCPAALPADFWPIRSLVLQLVRNRAYPLWQRMFLLGLFCQRLDSVARGDLQRTVAGFLEDFQAAIATGSVRASMETLPIDRGAQLDAVLRLAGMMLHKSNVRSRFVDCIQAFTSGIGNRPDVTFPVLTAGYTRAYDHAFAPFIERHPHILENLLINAIVRTQFPFGKEGMAAGAQPNKAREFGMLAAQFALVRGLLIGVAGHHGSSFSTAHVVHTVQAAARHFEHHPEFLAMAHTLLVESNMDGARGWAILLRNAETDQVSATTPAIPPKPQSANAPASAMPIEKPT